jgi:DNA-directed RNA polymerase subunit RPC12/RpoP
VTGPARDPRGLDEILAALSADGFVCSMTPLAGGDVRCGECGQESPAGDFEVESLRRTEGASDPGDMSAIAAITCPRCGARGAAVLRFGPEAGEADEDVLAALDRPGDSAT